MGVIARGLLWGFGCVFAGAFAGISPWQQVFRPDWDLDLPFKIVVWAFPLIVFLGLTGVFWMLTPGTGRKARVTGIAVGSLVTVAIFIAVGAAFASGVG
jgi:uncharacterized BrkB/YihY/UPF0761 family membrane protein